MILRQTNILLLVLALLVGCIDPIEFDLESAERQLVIDGSISNEPGPYVVRLSSSLSDSLDFNNRIPGATVTIVDENGVISTLVELSQGEYYSVSLQGEVGKSYQLRVVLANGETFESSFEKIPEPVTIDSLYFESVLKQSISSQGSTIASRGVEFFVDVRNSNIESSFYRWDFTGTYQITTANPVPNNPFNCWVTEKPVEYLNLGESASSAGEGLLKHPISFISNSIRTNIKYSMQLRQMAMNEATYNFWSDIQNLRENAGSIFDPPPARVIGNVSSTDVSQSPVLGYFAAYAISDKRVFVSRRQVQGTFPNLNQECIPIPGLPIPEHCSDCSVLPNSTSIIPPFWE